MYLGVPNIRASGEAMEKESGKRSGDTGAKRMSVMRLQLSSRQSQL